MSLENVQNHALVARPFAFLLTQFHPAPENDAVGRKRFTEWSPVAEAKPRFQGHRQPHLPADLGFYDLRVAERREAQATLARHAGLAGLCDRHLRFGHGRRIFGRTFEEVPDSVQPSLPFCSNIHPDGVDRYREAVLAPFDAVILLTPQNYVVPLGRAGCGRLQKRLRRRDFGARLEKIGFLNALNAGTEGNHVEPDGAFGHGPLSAIGARLRPPG